MDPIALAILFVSLVLIVFGSLALFSRFYVKVEQGKALIVNKMKPEPEVTFTGMIVLPVFYKAETMDISVKTIEIDRRGKEGLICQDNIRADIKVTFFVRVNKTRDDVIKVAQAIGCARASDQDTLEELFSAKFSEALKTVGKQMEFIDLYTKREDFRDRIIEVIGRDLNGYVLEDAAIDFLEQTALSSLDPNNILDAQGICKITELTTLEKVRTNEFTNNSLKLIKKQDVEAAETVLELERQEAEATAKQKREIETAQARETAEVAKIQAEERLRAETARIKADEELVILEQNKLRQVELSQKSRERALMLESERTEKERQMEVVSREREIELQRIAKEKALEEQRKSICEVIRERVAVEKTVAVEEESIKQLRVVEEAKRLKQSTIISAEAAAEEKLVKDIKAAEAAETAAKFKASELLIRSEAELNAADKQAQAKIRLAESLQAEKAAPGLAEAKVQEATALALEKTGAAEASVMLQKGNAEAMTAKGRFEAEAAGISQKAAAMKALDEAGREHEEFRLRLENDRILAIQTLEAQKVTAEMQAMVLGEALKNAKIDIIGGENLVLDRLVNSISLGKSIEGFVQNSDSAQKLVDSVSQLLGGLNPALKKQ
ncbi:MAG: flotillin family protein [Blastocatellia bacterium]|nr:flotillin family protein [Blastocatellia bacterium]